MLLLLLPLSYVQPESLASIVADSMPYLLTGGWLLLVFMTLWIAWETYLILKMIDYVNAIEWTFLQITMPPEAEQTPKAMEIAYDVWGGIHKNPDIIEKYFDGYLESWYSCELQCKMGLARYIMVVPTSHRRFFEGVIYGQYPQAEINEVEDYTLRFPWYDNGTKFNMYGTEVALVNDDIYPLKTYVEYEDKMAPEDRFIDPHQSLVEAYTNVGPGEEYWVQVLIRPIDAGTVKAWAKEGEEEIAKISGQAKKKKPSFVHSARLSILRLPLDIVSGMFHPPIERESKDEKPQLRFFNPVDEAKMKGILQKTSKGAFKTKIRIIYIAPLGQLHKPNISRAIGAFKQFNTFHLNSMKPDDATKTNGPNLFMKNSRRAFRERSILLNYQWRDFWGVKSGQMLNSEELATLYHFPVRYVQAPGVERSKAGLKTAPANLPYA